MYRYNTIRPAIAMIELIFAIVVIGITLMTAPMLMNEASKSGYVTIQQEAINEAASRVNMIMGYHWDEGDADPTVLDSILLTAGDANLGEAIGADGNGTGRRAGTPQESYRSFIDPDGNRNGSTARGALGIDAGDGVNEDDIDDFSGQTKGLNLEGTGLDANYVEKNVSIAISVAYISDTATSGAYNSNALSFDANFTQTLNTTSNIKRISTTLTSDSASPDELDKNITLQAFSCNIGGYQLEERDF